MADAVVSIVLENLADIIQNKIQEGIGLVRGVEEEVLSLSSELTAIRNVLDDAERRCYKEKSIQNWLNKLEDVSYEVDDVLDEWNFTILKLQIEGSENFVGPKQKKVRSFIQDPFKYFRRATTRPDIAVKIKGLKERLDLIVKEKDRYGFTVGQVVGPRQSERVRSTSFIDEKEIQGREDDKNVLVRELILEGVGQESGPRVISILGTGGIGKTTVAQLVFNDDRVINCFDLKIWICVSDVFDEVRIAKGIVEIVTKSSPNVHELEAILESMRNCISGKRFLLVLDDVWTEDYTKWEPLKNSLKCGGLGSKLLVTTRSERVARMMGTTDIHRLGQLSDRECWLLMQPIAFSGRQEEEHVELQDIGKNIANKCKGLPLAAKVLGSLLRFKDTVEEWENVLNSEIWQLEEAEVDLFPHLLLSYNELSPAMKRCFSYCSIFPKDSLIAVENLIRMWMAVGYLGSARSSSDLEFKGKEYFNNLRMRSLFQVFEELGDNMFCKMHDIVHDFAHFLMKRRSQDLEDLVGRVEIREKGSCQALNPAQVSQINVYRSLFGLEELPSNLSDSMICLRALSLQNVDRSIKIPGYIENLNHLRYLDLSANKLTVQVPQMISKLHNLQTLNLSYCGLKELPREIGNLVHLRHMDLRYSDIKELPREIWNLIHLRYLDLSYNKHIKELPREIGNLIHLRHLDLRYSDIKELPREIGNLIHLRHLDLSYNKHIKELPREIGNLIHLRHLDLRYSDIKEFSREIGNLIHLRHLDLSYNKHIKELPREIGNLIHLRYLDLRYSDIKELPREIGNLIHLRHLDLSYNKHIKELPREIGNLIHLRHLDLSYNKHIKELPREVGNLIHLRHLYLRYSDIKELPRQIGNLIHLRHLDLSFNSDIKELPETICYLHELRTLNLEHCGSLSKLPEEIYRLINLRHISNDFTFDLCQIPEGLEQLTALRTLRLFHAGRGWSKLGYLKKLNQLSGSLELKISLHDAEDILEAKKAGLRNKIHIRYLTILFFNDMRGSDGEELVKNEAMEALQPSPNLEHLGIYYFMGTKFPGWITSSLNHLKVLRISGWDYCLTLPPLGKLPCLEELSVERMKELKFLNKEFLGIEGDIGGSMPSSATIIGFPKLKRLSFIEFTSWEEWEDITAEEAGNTALSIMPCLKKVEICDCSLKELPHRLIRKASTLVDLIVGLSPHLWKLYEDKNGSGWGMLSHVPHVDVDYKP